MIDLHTHILYGLDDGAKTREETLEMLRIAVSEGIHTMVATPHFIHGANHYTRHDFQRRLAEVQEMASVEGCDINLLPGNEMLLDEWTLGNYQNQQVQTLNGSRYALVEFPLVGIPSYADNVLDGLLEAGYVPMIAHPERYPEIQEEPGMLDRFLYKGCLAQANSGSVTGIYGKAAAHTVKTLLTHNMIHAMATDCHTPGRRSPRVREVRDQVVRWIGKEAAQSLFETNPAAVLADQPIEVTEPLDIRRHPEMLRKLKGWFIQR